MPRPRTPKPHSASREGSGEETDPTTDPSSSIQLRRTRKRSAHAAREGSADQSAPQSSICPHIDDAQRTPSVGQHQIYPAHYGNGTDAAASNHASGSSSSFETPNQARERLVLTQSTSFNGPELQSMRDDLPQRSSRSARPSLHLRLSAGRTTDITQWRSHSMMYADHSAESPFSTDPNAPSGSSQRSDHAAMNVLTESQSSQRSSQQSQTSSMLSSSTSLTRSNSNMSPPRPTRSLPRRRASARTQSRPMLSSSNSSSSSYALRSRSTSNSNILGSSSSNANILASSQNNRQNMAMGCAPLGGGFDPTYNPPSGMSTPRTPLAEIPLWLADMRSESRRSSISSTSFIDREEFLNASRSTSSRHARTPSTSSTGPSSPGAVRNGSISPVVPFRRSLRGRRPRESDENARISPSPSYFGEYDALPSPSSASFRGGDMIHVDEALDPNAGLSSSMIHLGTSSPSTPSVQLQASSPAMSTRSRTLNRAGSVRSRRLTNPLNTPVSVEMLMSASESGRQRNSSVYAAYQNGMSINPNDRSASLLERRAAAANAAAASVASAAPQVSARVSSRPTSRNSSPARATRASRRRSTAAPEGQSSSAADAFHSFGPRPANLPPLQIPAGASHLAPANGLMMLNVPMLSSSSIIPEHAAEGLAAVAAQHRAVQMEPVSPSAFSEMTSLTQGSTASESMNSAGGMPVTPSSFTSSLDPFAQTVLQEGNTSVEVGPSSSTQVRRTRATAAGGSHGEASLDDADAASARLQRHNSMQRKNHLPARDANADEDALGIQLRPRP